MDNKNQITYLTGSYYYHINTELSDKDYIQFVLPTDHDLFYGKFTSKSIKDDEGNDINIKDIRMLLKELKKGSLRMFEILYSNPIEQINYINVFNSLLKSLDQMRDDIFQEQKGELLKAIQGELTGRYKKFKTERRIKTMV